MKNPLDLVAYLNGEQPFYRAFFLVFGGYFVATSTIVLLGEWTKPDYPAPLGQLAPGEASAALAQFAILFCIFSGVSIWILGRCSKNIAATPARYFGYTFVSVLLCAWVFYVVQSVPFIVSVYGI